MAEAPKVPFRYYHNLFIKIKINKAVLEMAEPPYLYVTWVSGHKIIKLQIGLKMYSIQLLSGSCNLKNKSLKYI